MTPHLLQVCTPTIERDCQKVKVKTQAINAKEDCVKVVRTVCTEVNDTDVLDTVIGYFCSRLRSWWTMRCATMSTTRRSRRLRPPP